ncbi:MAG TPA: gamma-glutamyltransferase [Usitatibacter sp.]|nr:gamma-glutamyltransferase [Usitatibacter sp.]
MNTRSLWVALFAAASSLCVAQAQAPASAKRYMVAAAHPLAVDAGLAMIERGGSAVDAMIAVQLVLNLVEPQSSGLGGGAYLLYYDARRGKLFAYDGRETAPAGAVPTLLTGADGNALPFAQARAGGRAVGVPGTARLLEVAHARHGKLPWATLFAPAIGLAEQGFPMPARLAHFAARESLADPAAKAWLYDAAGRAKAPGERVVNRDFASLLRTLAAQGADGFYRGDVARDIVRAVHAPPNAGTLSEDDLAGYRVRDVEPVCAPYRTWRVCGVGPSTYGGIGVLQILGVLERFDLAAVRPGSTEAVHLFSEAGRIAYADRNRYGGDDRFTPVPVAGLVDGAYLAERSQLIRSDRSMGAARAGMPRGATLALADDAMEEIAGTSHVSIVDAQGNAVALTTTIEGIFGSRVVARGLFLNNELTDFNYLPFDEGRLAANSVAPGKRPRSSMAPTMVFDRDGALAVVAGSPGGSQIINYVARALVATLDWNLDAQRAVALANFGSRNGPTEIERGTELQGVSMALKSMGHDVREIEMNSGLHLIRRVPGGWQGGADPRVEGVARGR